MTARPSVPAAKRLAQVTLGSFAALLAGTAAPGSFGTTAAEGSRATAPTVAAARTARAVNLVENARLSLTSEGGTTLNERGRAVGTFDAPLTAHLNLYAGHVTAIFTIYPKGGSITGKAYARFAVSNSIVYYGGTLNIVHGTGAYRHAAGSGVGISGTINHLTFALTVKAHGPITL